MPLEQLEGLVVERAKGVEAALADKHARIVGESSPGPALPAPAAGAAPMTPPSPAPDELNAIAPDVMRAASAALVTAGLLEKASDTMTPEVLKALFDAAERTSPGLYNLDNPDDLQEFVEGLANGRIRLDAAAAPGPGAAPGGDAGAGGLGALGGAIGALGGLAG